MSGEKQKSGKQSSGAHRRGKLAKHVRRLRMKMQRWLRYREEGRHLEVRKVQVRRLVDVGQFVMEYDEDGAEREVWKDRWVTKTVNVERKRTWATQAMEREYARANELLDRRKAATPR